jgi:hypothetical protein
MKKLSDKEIARALSQRGTPEPPSGLAGQIKAEIPELLEVGGGAFEPTGRGGGLRFGGLRPLWLIAACLLVVMGAGFMALRLLTPPTDLSREIALGGVTRITDVVVTVPERGTVEGQKLAMAENRVSKAAPPLSPPAAGDLVAEARNVRAQREPKATAEEQFELGKADTRAADQAALPGGVPASETAPAAQAHAAPAEAAKREAKGAPGDGAKMRAVATPAFAPAVPTASAIVARGEAAPSTAAPVGTPVVVRVTPKGLLAAAPARETVTVVVRTAAGVAVAGVPVSLQSLGKRDAKPLEGVTGADGAVAFAAVPAGHYRATAKPAGGSPVVLEPVEVPAGKSRTFELRLPPPLS